MFSKTQQTTATESTAEMKNHNREDNRDANHQMTNTTHHIVYQGEAAPNCTEYSNHHQDKDKQNQIQYQVTHQPEEENPDQLCSPKAKTLTTMAMHASKNHKPKRNKQIPQQSHQTFIAMINK